MQTPQNSIYQNRHVVFGGQYGSEGKGNYVEHLIGTFKSKHPELPITVIAEPSPNSGHTCSLGKLRQLPTGAFWANLVYLGPDSVINPDLLALDVALVMQHNPAVTIIVHKHAAVLTPRDIEDEQGSGIVTRVASTASGVGVARRRKFIEREEKSVVFNRYPHAYILGPDGRIPRVAIVGNDAWINSLIPSLSLPVHESGHFVFECNQGVMLDPNFGLFPYCTSRTTLPMAALARNGVLAPDLIGWMRHMVIRTFPIRTGGNSGPTGAKEIEWSDLGIDAEVATVTKRIRRVFEFSENDFKLAYALTKPHVVAVTHGDYTGIANPELFWSWMAHVMAGSLQQLDDDGVQFLWSREPGIFNEA